MRIGLIVIMAIGLTAGSSGRDYFVSPTGNDAAPGSADAPFRTIQRAADLAVAGDVCHVAPGVYRETVRPKQSGRPEQPIVFRGSPDGGVTIMGADPVDAWTGHAGSIYKALMDWSLGKHNQIFFDGRPLQEARWPNDRDGDPMTPDGVAIEDGDVDHILCSRFPDDWQAGDLDGAVVWALPQSAWSSWTAVVTDYDPGAKKVSFPSFAGNWWVQERHNPSSKEGTFYLVGALKLLDAPGEWFYDANTRMLYLWTPDGGDPNEHRVAAKSRLLGMDLNDRSWITVDGIDLQGCSIDLDDAQHCVVRNMTARQIHHTRGGKTIASIGEKSGIYVGGHQNRLENCEIAYSAGSGVSLSGTDNAVVNCWIHHTDYIGAYCAPVNMKGMRHLVSHNTIAYTGRDCIKLGGAEHLIQFNDIGFPGRICHDLGAVYSGGQDGGNTRIRYNYVHDNPGKASNVGIYLDNYMKNYIVDHNVVWNVGNGIRLNRPTGFCMVFNNTVFKDITNNWGPWKGQKVQWGCHVLNNLCEGEVKMNPEVVTRANLPNQDLSDLFDRKTRPPGNTMPDQGKGIVVTRTASETTDIGAYQHNHRNWQAGHDFEHPPTVAYLPATEPLRNYLRNAAFEYSRYYEGTPTEVEPLIHWRRQGAGKVDVEFHSGFNSPPANARNSVHGNSLVLSGDDDSGVSQEVPGLVPDTRYFFSGYVKHADGENVEFAVELVERFVAKSASATIKLEGKQTWRFLCVEFQTGPDDRSATVSIMKRGAGLAYVDDTGVVPASYGLQAK